MPGITFRGKLLLASTVVVVAATGAALVVTQRTVAQTTRRLFAERAAREGELFAMLEDLRLRAVRAASARAARSVRLVAALEEGDPALLYRTAADELRGVLHPAAEGDATPAAFFRLVDAHGRVVPPVDERAGPVGATARAVDEEIAQAMTRLAPDAVQAIGYLGTAVDGGPRLLHEVVLTRVLDVPTRRPRGALVLGFPFTPAPDAPPLRSRVLVGSDLYGGPAPEPVPAALRAALRVLRDDADAEPVALLDGVPHRVFMRPLHSESPFPPAAQVLLYSLAEPRAEQRALRLRMLGVALLAAVLGVALAAVIARSLARPIGQLVAATGAVGAGALDTHVAVRGGGELAQLADAFNRMTADLALKDRYRYVLDLIADRRVAADLLSGRLALGGELREVSVLFCDIRGFTALIADMAPADVVSLLNAHMAACTAAIHAHGGVVNKFVGDAVMALFGAPQPTGDDAGNAIRAARALVAARTRLNAEGAHDIAVGIGVTSGPVVAGCAGARERLEYTVLGWRVNLAARLAAQAGPMEILMCEATRARVAGERPEALPPLALKGFAQPVAAFRLRPDGAGTA